MNISDVENELLEKLHLAGQELITLAGGEFTEIGSMLSKWLVEKEETIMNMPLADRRIWTLTQLIECISKPNVDA